MINAVLEILMKQLKIMLKTVEKSETARLRANQIVDSILEDLESEKPSVSTFNAYLAAHTKNYELEVENEKLNRECKRLQEELDMLKAEKESLEEKHESECRQISAYDEELKETKGMATIYDFARMCRANNDCEFCPMTKAKLAVDYEYSTCAEMMTDHPDEANAAILKWCAEHTEQPESVSEQPTKKQKTYKQDFLEKFPNAERRMDGSPSVCRNKVYNCGGCFLNKSCVSCWNEVMENADE